MTSFELRQEFLNFFKKKGHKIVPSSSLLPADATLLFTSAGMQQFIPYLSGEKDILKDFNNRHLCSVQKCFRANDIDEVGDDTHHTFFEMLGNWSIGKNSQTGYFKEGAIKYALEFFLEVLGLNKDKFWITVFSEGKDIPQDKESIKIWEEKGIPKERIVKFGINDNFWGPVGETGPCGPCSEIHYDRGKSYGCGERDCGPNCQRCNRFVELWNLVFMEYNKNKEGVYTKLPQSNVDTGIGFERLVSVLQDKDSAYETDLFFSIIQKIEELSGQNYSGRAKRVDPLLPSSLALGRAKRVDPLSSPLASLGRPKNFRVIADHIRGAVFLISEGIFPSNVERGYVLRRVLRKAIRYGKLLNLPKNFLIPLAQKVIEIYQDVYPEVKSKEADILTVIQNEEEKFEKTLSHGLKQFGKIVEGKAVLSGVGRLRAKATVISGTEVFHLFDTYGFPLELTEELAKEKKLKVDKEGFKEAFEKHREISRAGMEKKFGGVGKEATYEATKLHTATHLLHTALREILGKQVKQMGSDITSQRLRFDFSHSQKMTEEEIKKVEDLVNQKIKEDLEIKKEELPYQEALKTGALAFFKEKYPDMVTVYLINNWSKEICAGPHIRRTSELGIFKIIKEESSGAGVRRIRAILK